jgi:hypothetical protein
MERFSVQMLKVPGIVDFLHFLVPSENIDVAVWAIRTIHTLAPGKDDVLLNRQKTACQKREKAAKKSPAKKEKKNAKKTAKKQPAQTARVNP